MTSPEQTRLESGAAEVIPSDGLRARLALDRPLRVKLGIDPSRPDLHLGHAVVLRKLRQFQDLRHTAVLIIGDFTGRVGDPSGMSETRPMLSVDEIEANARTYLEQAGLVLDLDRAEVRHNSEWLASMGMDDVLRLTAATTVARMLEREDFRARYQEGRPISLVEFLYPLLQAMDSVAIEADVELGGTDQTFNLLVGRSIQEAYGQDPQVVLTMPLLEGTDGKRKMSKSFDNFVGLTDPPEEMFGRLMRVPDGLIPKYLRLCTDLDPAEVDSIEAGLADGALHAGEQKRRLARAVVDLYHGTGAGPEAERRFDLVHREHEIPDDVPERPVSRAEIFVEREPGVRELLIGSLLVELGLAGSRSEGRRLVAQGGVRVDGAVVEQDERRWTAPDDELVGTVWQVGRRRFARVGSLSE